VTLRRLFKAVFGVPIIEYVRSRNLDAARLMLREGRFQVAEVGYRVGYSDPANFTNAYRRRFGRPPTQDIESFQ
jgi:AraC-like DNA-binding protein